MKEKIQGIVRHCYKDTRSRILSGTLLIAFIVGITAAYVFTIDGGTADAATEMIVGSSESSYGANIGVVGDESVTSTGNVGPNNSWPGELISSDIAQVQPQREGVITEWLVHVGQSVYAGQVLAKVSAPPHTPELTQMLAEQTESVERARAQVRVIDEYTRKEQVRINALSERYRKRL